MSHPSPSSPSGYVSIAEAARILDVKPWDVVRLIENNEVQTIQFVEVSSLPGMKGAA